MNPILEKRDALNVINELENNGGKDGFKLDPEEAEKLKKNMDDPKFQDLLRDYMTEIGDPKYRKEQEEYISQLESEQKIPKGKALLRPRPGFVIKTFYSPKKGSKSVKEEQKLKLFVNLVQSDEVSGPEKGPIQSHGASLSIPHIAGPLRLEKDNSNVEVMTMDVCLNPEALTLASSRNDIKDLIVNSSLESSEKVLSDKFGYSVEVERSYRVLKGVAHKGGTPPTMLYRKSSDAGAQSEDEKETNVQPQLIPGNKEKSKSNGKSMTVKKGFLNQKSTQHLTEIVPKSEKFQTGIKSVDDGKRELKKEDPRELDKKNACSKTMTSPSCTLKERGEFELANHTLGREIPSCRPKELVLQFNVPEGIKSSELQLDVAERLVKITDGQTNKVLLEFKLPYPVMRDDGTAQYDKSKSILTVVMPVVKPTVGYSPSSEADCVIEDSMAQDTNERNTSAPIFTIKNNNKSLDNKRWLDENNRNTGEKFVFEKKIQVEQTGQFNNELDLNCDVCLKIDGFESSKIWRGPRPSYVFKLGKFGIGYYKEDINHGSNDLIGSAIYTNVGRPEFDFHENEKTLSLLIQVENVCPDGVISEWETRSGSFRAKTMDGTSLDLCLELRGSIDPSKSRFSIASNNVALVLYKDPPGIWGGLELESKITNMRVRTDLVADSNKIEVPELYPCETLKNTHETLKNIREKMSFQQPIRSSLIYELD